MRNGNFPEPSTACVGTRASEVEPGDEADMNTRVLTPRFGSKKKIGSLDYADRNVSTCKEIFLRQSCSH